MTDNGPKHCEHTKSGQQCKLKCVKHPVAILIALGQTWLRAGLDSPGWVSWSRIPKHYQLLWKPDSSDFKFCFRFKQRLRPPCLGQQKGRSGLDAIPNTHHREAKPWGVSPLLTTGGCQPIPQSPAMKLGGPSGPSAQCPHRFLGPLREAQ